MRHWFLGLAVAIALASTAAAAEKAEAIIKKAIEAHGGSDALTKYKAAKTNMKGDLSINGTDIEFKGSTMSSGGDRYKFELTADIMGAKLVIHQVVKGDVVKSKVTVNDMAQPEPGDEEKADLKFGAAMQDVQQLVPLLDDKRYELKAGDDDEVDGKKVAVVVVKLKKIDKECKLAFDKTSGLLLKVSRKGRGPGEGGASGEVQEETILSDYKKVNGMQVAMKMLVNHDGKKFATMTLSDYEVLEKIDDKEFGTDD